MQHDYTSLINAALERAELASLSDPEGRARQEAIDARYGEALRAFLDQILAEKARPDAMLRVVNRELDEIRDLSEADMLPVLDKVRYDIVSGIEEEAGPSPSRRKAFTRLVGLGGVLVTLLLVGGFVGLRSYNAIPITASIETRAGLEQRAAALSKTLRYGKWMSGRKGGVFREILLWPIQPTESETAGAREFAGLVLEGADALAGRNEVCKLPTAEDEAAQLAMISRVADHLADTATTWRDPPLMTVLDPLRTGYPC